MAQRDVTDAFELFGGDGSDSDADDSSQSPVVVTLPQPAAPRTLLDRCTVELSDDERAQAQFHETTVRRAAACLREHGIVILPRLFDGDAIAALGDAALDDLAAALAEVNARGLGKGDLIFKELASRQAGRFELRNGRALGSALAAHRGGEGAAPLTDHLGLVRVLRDACAPRGGPPLSAQRAGDRIAAKDVGAFVSLPGAADQPVHADNDHIFWDQTLPPHVVTMFLPALRPAEEEGIQRAGASATRGVASDERAKVGWTAFLPGTHHVERAPAALADTDAAETIHPRLNGTAVRSLGTTRCCPLTPRGSCDQLATRSCTTRGCCTEALPTDRSAPNGRCFTLTTRAPGSTTFRTGELRAFSVKGAAR